MPETVLTYCFYLIVLGAPLAIYLARLRRREARARQAAEKGELYSEGPRAQRANGAGCTIGVISQTGIDGGKLGFDFVEIDM